MQLVMGELPDDSRRVPLDVQIVEEVHDGDIVRQRLTFATEPGDRCWAWLLTPVSRRAPGAAMLCLHQTTKLGKDEPTGLGGKPNLHYALELSRRGYVTLSPDYPGYGQYKIDCYAMGYASATMKGIWNHIRAMDLLASLPTVDARRIGCIGHSLGGHNTLFVAAFDERIRVAVSSCGFTRLTWNDDEGRGRPGDLSDWCHAGYMPRIKDRYHCRAENMPFDFDHVLGVIAPRALFINGPRRDCMRWEGVKECVEQIAQEYARHGAPERLGWQYPDCEHDFPPDVREQAYRFVDRILGQERS
jgi:acetyl esterase/lipase